MSHTPDDLLYTKDHEWLKAMGDGTALVGITDYAQQSLGDITFVEFPGVGDTFAAGDTFGVVESVKAASDLYMPVDAEVLEVNGEVDARPELLNSDPYAGGWLLKVRLGDAAQMESLMGAEAYRGII